MVLIIKKILRKRGDLVFMPKAPLIDLLERHVARIDLPVNRITTCIVDNSDGKWTGKPSSLQVTKLLFETLYHRGILAGEKRYPIPHHIFEHIQCRNFNHRGYPVSEPFEGDFLVNLIRIKGKCKRVIKDIQPYESTGWIQRRKIKKAFEKLEARCDKLFVFIAVHIHPAKKRKI